MPLYETVMQEKPPVVLEIGNAYTKLGFAAEPHPRKIIRSATYPAGGEEKNLFQNTSVLHLYDDLVDFLQIIFFKHLLVSPKDRKIVIVENVFGPIAVRETLAKILFRHFEVSSILFTPSHVMALSTLGVQTAVVVDVGYIETTVLPVFSGVQIMKAFQDQQFGGKSVHMEIKRQLIETGVDAAVLTEEVLEDIKVRACFVTTFERALAYRNDKAEELTPQTIEVSFPICNDIVIKVPGRIRETAFEVMFEENNDCDSLPHLILKSILLCPIDIRRELMENIFTIGGSCIIKGFLPRLKSELLYLMENDATYKEKLPTDVKLKFHQGIGCQNISSWLGASLCGGTDLIHSKSLTKEVYAKYDHVPDWISINRLNG